MSEIHQYHDEAYDPLLQEAITFAGQELGLRHIAGMDQITVIDRDHLPAIPGSVRHHYGLDQYGGGYDPATGDVLVVQSVRSDMPRTTRVEQGSGLVHEITHSGTANTSEHPFYNEALAGMGEAKYMAWLAKHEVHRAAGAVTLRRAGVELWIPGEMRRVHDSESHLAGQEAMSTQGLVAALGVGYGLNAKGVKSAAILRASRPGGTVQFDVMKQSLDMLQPGLSKRIERDAGDTDGIIQATARAESAARKAGIIP